MLIFHPSMAGYKPLAHAVMMQQLAAVKRLVKMGASINAQDSKGRTGLAVAAYQVKILNEM